MKKNILKALLIPAAFLALSCSIISVMAQGVSVKLQPAIIEERVDPGKILPETIRVTNPDPVPQTLYLFAQDIQGMNPDGQPVFLATGAESPYGLSSWLSLTASSLTLGPGETREVPFKINVPQSAAPGGHFGAIFVSAQSPKPQKTGSAVSYQVGTIISLRVSGEALEEARIREFRSDRSIYGSPNAKFTVRVENLGNVLVKPRGPLEITNMLGKKVATLRVNNDGAGIFPKSERQFEAAWENSGLSFGRYQAVVSLVYGDDVQKTISATVSFWVLPVVPIVSVLLGIAVLIGAVLLLMRWYVRKKMRELGVLPGAAPVGAEARTLPAEKLPFSRLMFVTVALIALALVFLVAIFFLFS